MKQIVQVIKICMHKYIRKTNMEYKVSVQMRMPTFVSCNNCDLWFPIEYIHCCIKNIEMIIYDHNTKWNIT